MIGKVGSFLGRLFSIGIAFAFLFVICAILGPMLSIGTVPLMIILGAAWYFLGDKK